MDSSTIKAWRFFLEHAGYCTPPGRAACALNLARAEAGAHNRDWHVEWTDSPIGCDGCCRCDGTHGREHDSVEDAALYDSDGNVLASLGGITDATAQYRRVVEAELADEALYHERTTLAVMAL